RARPQDHQPGRAAEGRPGPSRRVGRRRGRPRRRRLRPRLLPGPWREAAEDALPRQAGAVGAAPAPRDHSQTVKPAAATAPPDSDALFELPAPTVSPSLLESLWLRSTEATASPYS